MTAYRRPVQLARTLQSIYSQQQQCEVVVVEDGRDGETERVARKFPVKYLCREDRPVSPTFYCPSVVTNMGLRAATGDIVVLQNAEGEHVGDVLKQFRERVPPRTAVFATVDALHPDGSFNRWYCHPKYNRRPMFFCGAMRREHFFEVGLFDEDFTDYGYEDVDFADRMELAGIQFEWAEDIRVHHQWHETYTGEARGREVYNRKRAERGQPPHLT
jgi:GT2 family glycosyltransferase